MTPSLPAYLELSAARVPGRTAVVGPSGETATYAQLRRDAEAVAAFLRAQGVRRGDRVGVVLPKSVAAVTALFGIMRAGAAYVPVDVTAPADRGRRILTDCDVRAAIVDWRVVDVVPRGEDGAAPITIVVGRDTDDLPPGVVGFADVIATPAAALDEAPGLDDLAYILYTSGSTGMPKGVMLTHRNATSFVDWCSSIFHPTPEDRFSSHAPFHFDLSVLDIYVAIKHGATLFLISEDLGKNPKALAQFIAEHRLTVWYSTPSILTLLTQHGGLDRLDMSALRLVLFAGEVFPVKHLRALQRAWPHPIYYNLYGPTETNVCTFAKIPAGIPDERETPYPIGFLCEHCDGLVLDGDGKAVGLGDEGLLYISGPSTFDGYWNRPVENAAAFIERQGRRWYNTGDVVRWDAKDGYIYAGRRDRMVKRRGYRIELGEIERALYLHPRLREVAVVAMPDADAGVKIYAFVSCQDGPRPSIIDLKMHCGSTLPAYMSPDTFVVEAKLPRTSTDKVDYQALRGQLTHVGAGHTAR